jgi:ferredoxin
MFKKKIKKGKVRFEPMGIEASITNEASVLELGLNHGVEIANSCGGSGSCGTCRVFIKEGANLLAPRSDVEQAMADARNFLSDERLSCQIEPADGLIIEVPD